MVAAVDTRTTQAAVVSLTTGKPDLHVTQVASLALFRIPALDLQTTQAANLTLVTTKSELRTTQAAVMVLWRGITENRKLRVWTFTVDGHDFYVLRLGDTLTLVYDTYSEQWMDWSDAGSLKWRAQCGMNWAGGQALSDVYGTNVVAGDDTFGLLWFLDPTQPFDQPPDALAVDQQVFFPRLTMGQVPIVGREVLPCYAVWLTTDMGDPAYLGAGVTLYTSDDAGVSWDDQGLVTVTAGEASPQLSWYSLGQISAPGRLFKVSDDGAVTRIDTLEMNDPDAKNGG